MQAVCAHRLASAVLRVAVVGSIPADRAIALVCGQRSSSACLSVARWPQPSASREGFARGTDLSTRAAASMSAPPTSEYVAAYITVPSREVGLSLAKSLLEAELAACVNIIPGVESVYRWEGKVECDPELLLMVKTKSSLVSCAHLERGPAGWRRST
eukprot:scaffold432_cov345-Prasinococcus_capsulatus_cf.AAC.5